jgi:DNA-binding response OmpR family regulator
MPKKILIIEDEQSLSDVLEIKLKKEGYDVVAISDGAEGYQKLKSWAPDLLLLDIQIPTMNGYEVMEKMRDENVNMPVIVISNSGQPIEIEKTKKLGAVDHLIKAQFDPSEVVYKVNVILDPEKAAKQPIPSQEAGEASAESGGTGSVKILLVEDDKFLRDICRTKLVKEGFNVHEAMDGEQALQDIEKVKPDIVLLDIILPNIDGYQVLTEIRAKTDAKISKVPIIMLSNLGQEDDIKRALDLGANNYLVKAHFTTDEIVEKIKKELGLQ